MPCCSEERGASRGTLPNVGQQGADALHPFYTALRSGRHEALAFNQQLQNFSPDPHTIGSAIAQLVLAKRYTDAGAIEAEYSAS